MVSIMAVTGGRAWVKARGSQTSRRDCYGGGLHSKPAVEVGSGTNRASVSRTFRVLLHFPKESWVGALSLQDDPRHFVRQAARSVDDEFGFLGCSGQADIQSDLF
jgi:hypothetical protein